MKEIDELNLPGDVRYVESHEWARIEGETVRVGISDYAQDRLGDITFVEFPQLGDVFGKGDQFGTVESTKAVSDLFMPVGGEVLAINTELAESPGLINSDPYGSGWIMEVRPEGREDLDSLLTHDSYRELLRGLD